MQIVIDIDDKVYGLLKYFEKGLGLNDKKDSNDDVKTAIMRAVINGIPLPKGHGVLVDISPLMRGLYEEKCVGELTYTTSEVYRMLDDETTTIIEADKENEDKE